MGNKIVKYSLNSDGTIPDDISDGGYFPNNNILIGATADGSDYAGDGELSTQSAVKSYLDSYGPFKEKNEKNPLQEIELNTNDLASFLWNKKK
tara:strand:- start:121 stop:399 length:279 start_codon:yes stop_codon:yes gene_type:complete